MRFNKQHLIKLGILGLASLSLAACNLGQGGNNSSNTTTNAKSIRKSKFQTTPILRACLSLKKLVSILA